MSMLDSPIAGALPQAQTSRGRTRNKLRGFRLIACVGLSISMGLAVTMMGPRLGGYHAAEQPPDCPDTQALTNLVFIIDRSGSMQNKIEGPHEGTSSDGRGQTYNVEIEGVRRALLDPSVIPRDGSVSVGAVLFDGEASIILPLTPRIGSDADAMSAADRIKPLVVCPDLDSNIPPCPAGETDFGKAISQADQVAGSGARRVFILSTDGEPSNNDDDRVNGVLASQLARVRAGEAELDVILIGVPTETKELEDAKLLVERLAFPSPPADLPGVVEVIVPTECNKPKTKHSVVDTATFEEECGCQVKQFADFVRRALRGNIALRSLTVATTADTAPGTPFVEGSPRSLRQAIETANANGGRTTITFSSGMTIRPSQPLPPLTAPDITICGCAAGCAPSIPVKVTCAETSQDEAIVCDRRVSIDGQFQLDDGIMIRSNRDVVRGLRITGFLHAGIVIQPVCPSDNTGFNRIELNKLENNIQAGICVLDPRPGVFNAVTHNVGNTISMNDISGSETPIDLGSSEPFPANEPASVCDGPTLNDVGDADEGPNTLLNFPDTVVVQNASNGNAAIATVTIAGQINSPPLGGGTVEIFAANLRRTTDKVVLDNVIFLGSAPLVGNSFSASGLPVSPSGFYTATLTDSNGNTSELTICSGSAKAVLSTSSLNFRDINVGESRSLSFTITNTGCVLLANLDFKLFRMVGNKEKKDKSGVFSVVPQGPQKEFPMEIAPGDTQTFDLTFKPAIPGFVPGFTSSPKLLLPEFIQGRLKFSSDAGEVSLNILAHIVPQVILINSDGTQDHPAPTLTRSGDIFEVTFYVFDSNPLDIVEAVFAFAFVDNGKCITVPVDNDTASLAGVITQAVNPPPPTAATKRAGQSLKVIQRFSNANEHPKTRFVKVTVRGKGQDNTATCCEFPCGQANNQAVRQTSDTTLVLPPLKRMNPAGSIGAPDPGGTLTGTGGSGSNLRGAAERKGKRR
ncbi:MAG: hypothetical protein AABO41_14130 [Acidobacteriota bacterium]